MVTQGFLPYADSLGIFGAIFAVCILTISTMAFYSLKSDPARMRAALIVNLVGWPVLLVASTLFFLAAYVLPMAKCAA